LLKYLNDCIVQWPLGDRPLPKAAPKQTSRHLTEGKKNVGPVPFNLDRAAK
jgi:hypothetical protein